jgi:hypothetical protein
MWSLRLEQVTPRGESLGFRHFAFEQRRRRRHGSQVAPRLEVEDVEGDLSLESERRGPSR